MKQFNVFDANCRVGRYRTLQEGGLFSAPQLLEDMDHFGITEALVLDSLSREVHPRDGNERILRETAGQPRLHPAWAALPPGAPDEQLAPETLLAKMKQSRVGALFLLPGQYEYSLSDWSIDELLEPLAEAKVPVFVNYNDLGNEPLGWDKTDWDEVVALCRRWPRLPVIVGEWRIRRSNRLIYRALEACENLRIELSGYWLYRGIEYITRNWGAQRLIFGSNWPEFGHGQTLAMLACAEISDEDKRLIAGDNLRSLVSWCEPGFAAPAEAKRRDAYHHFALTGERAEEIRVHDCHGHLGLSAHYHVPDGDTDKAVAEMDRFGIAQCCVFSLPGVFGDEKYGNDVVADAIRRYPERFIGFTLLNPHRGRDDMLFELDRCAKLGFRGIKLIASYHGYPEEDPLIDVACQWAHERKQIILNHYWGSSKHTAGLLSRYPDACFITGHTTVEYAEIMKRYPNLYVCSCPLLGPRTCEEVVKAIGADRLLFGSDLLDLPVSWGLGPILCSRLSVDEKRLILGGNLQRILKTHSLKA